MLQSPSRQLGEFLVERKVLSRDVLVACLEREETEGVPLASILVQENLVSEKDLLAAVANQVGVPFFDLALTVPRPDLSEAIPSELAREYKAVAVDLVDDVLLVAMENPGDEGALKEISAATGYELRAGLAERTELAAAIERSFPTPGVEKVEERGLHLNDLLLRMLELRGSDLHLTAEQLPTVRVDGEMRLLDEFETLTGSDIRRLVYEVLTQKQRERFEDELELDTSHSIPGHGRFRVNVLQQKNNVGSVMRAIPDKVVPLDQLGLPDAVRQFGELPRGLVLVTGPTGSGKSTTLASLIDIINSTRRKHIVTVEDPIEFVHSHKRCIVNQREVGEDTHGFAEALKHVLRQDPDIILVGEMRDLETIGTALTAAETGHLVFATLHTQDAPQSVDRIIDVFPPEQQQQVRVQLASSLMGVMTQQLLPMRGARGRTVAAEVLVVTPAIRNLIREGKTHQIPSAMQAGGKFGMQTMDQSLAGLVKAGKIDMHVALERCANPDDLKKLTGQ